ncbi:MAG: SsrA-binding protein SmpB [Polyangiaceae bacterium]|nr:SsrA-binding protein SmpB [Polyangiaceae bacterium]
MSTPKEEAETIIVRNRRASFDYQIDETFEGGLELLGSEVKSIRAGKVDLVDAYCAVEKGECFLKQLYVAPFTQAKAFPHEVRRSRKVLLHAREIERLSAAIMREGYTLIVTKIYLVRGRIKVEIGVAKGKKTYDKRHDMAKKTADKEARDAIGRARKGTH